MGGALGLKRYWWILGRGKVFSIVILIGEPNLIFPNSYWKEPRAPKEQPVVNIQFQD